MTRATAPSGIPDAVVVAKTRADLREVAAQFRVTLILAEKILMFGNS
jgi:hypothetical protein